MSERSEQSRGAAWLLPVAGAGAVLLIIGAESPRALLFLAADGTVAAALLAAAAMAGLWLPVLFRLGELPLRWHLLLGAGLGVGVLALLVLTFGLAGWLARTLWVVPLVCGPLAGVIRLAMLVRRAPRGPLTPGVKGGLKLAARYPSLALGARNRRGLQPATWTWLVVCPFAALALLVALVPPGLLWAEEGNGYDVLEYHLQMPREYFQAGRIAYAPHNVYANFPANAEMLYLLAMVLRGGPLAGVGVAQLLNAMLAFLTVAAAWLAGRETSPTAGVVAGVLAATTGWLTYLSGLAYVENAMLFFAMLALAAMVRASAEECLTPLRWLGVAGVLAGWSAGCKYTAVVLIVLPLLLAVSVGRWPSLRHRLAACLVFALSAAGSFAPWMLKNVVFTGNPVFPLAGEVFHAYPEGWSTACSEHFDRSHAPGPEEATVGARLGMLWAKVMADKLQRFGPAVFLLALTGLVANGRRRLEWQLGLMLLAQIGLWLGLTHLYARFAVVFLLPMVVLGGRFLNEWNTPIRRLGLMLLVGGAIWNLVFLVGLYRRHIYTESGRIGIEGTPEVFTGGQVPSYEHLGVINHELPADAKILLVGEARAFYFLRNVDYYVVFNRNPFIEVVGSASDPSVVRGWLAAKGYTHVYVAWSEIERLRRSRYGFPEVITHERFDGLVAAEVLRRTHRFRAGTAGRVYAELYEMVKMGKPPQ